jgi:hypothetical protein
MAQKRGRPPTPLDPMASYRARLGAALRTFRLDEGLTLEKLADRIDCATPQHMAVLLFPWVR